MGNSARKQKKINQQQKIKDKKQKTKDVVDKQTAKDNNRTFLFIGDSKCGKTEFINQLISIHYNANITELNWNKSSYNINNISSFTINEYNTSTTADININNTPIRNDNKMVLISGYLRIISISQINIPHEIKEIILKYISLPIISSYLLNNNIKLWECSIFNFNNFQLNELNELYKYINCLIFMIDISGYNEYNKQKQKQINKLTKSINLFKRISKEYHNIKLNSNQKPTFILYLNKCDLFRNKINKSIQLNECDVFSDYIKDNNNEIKAISNKCIELFKKYSSQSTIGLEIHVITATDINCVKNIFQMCQVSVEKNEWYKGEHGII